MIYVHIKPAAWTGGDLHQWSFPDGTSPATIIEVLTQSHMEGGKEVRAVQYGFGRLKDGKLYLDHPDTIVSIGTISVVGGKKTFTETQRIRGPVAAPEPQTAYEAAQNPSVN